MFTQINFYKTKNLNTQEIASESAIASKKVLILLVAIICIWLFSTRNAYSNEHSLLEGSPQGESIHPEHTTLKNIDLNQKKIIESIEENKETEKTIEENYICEVTPPEQCEPLKKMCKGCSAGELNKYAHSWKTSSSLNDYLELGEQYRDMIENALLAEGLPIEYYYLALAESGGKHDNVSHAGAVGLWQLMPFISRHYGLKVNKHIDDRTDPSKATSAAVKYIKRNMNAFDGDARWAIAAYNAGGTNIKRMVHYKKGRTPFTSVAKKSYDSYALAGKVLNFVYETECGCFANGQYKTKH